VTFCFPFWRPVNLRNIRAGEAVGPAEHLQEPFEPRMQRHARRPRPQCQANQFRAGRLVDQRHLWECRTGRCVLNKLVTRVQAVIRSARSAERQKTTRWCRLSRLRLHCVPCAASALHIRPGRTFSKLPPEVCDRPASMAPRGWCRRRSRMRTTTIRPLRPAGAGRFGAPRSLPLVQLVTRRRWRVGRVVGGAGSFCSDGGRCLHLLVADPSN
jgi:hypothetical protein